MNIKTKFLLTVTAFATLFISCEKSYVRIEPVTTNPAVCASIGEIVHNVGDSLCSNSNSYWISSLRDNLIYVVNDNEELERIAPGQSQYIDLENNTLIISAFWLLSSNARCDMNLWLNIHENLYSYIIDVTYPSSYSTGDVLVTDCRLYKKIDGYIHCEFNETFEDDDD